MRRLNLRYVIAWLSFAFLMIGLGPIAFSADRPNIVLIMADDMGYECLGANGSTFYSTPNLDRLAASGIRFEHAYSQPICTPSRVQIMTGRYNARNYVRFGLLDRREVTFGNVLKDAGYATCVVGKWQLQGGFDGPRHFGFDEYCLWQLTRRPTRYPNPGLEINGKEVDFTDGKYGPDIVSDYLIDFIRRHKEGPFFAYYPMILPHWPFQPTPDSADWDPMETDEWPKPRWSRRHFRDMVGYADKMVGKVVDALDALGIRENTLVVFTADNGTYFEITSPFQGRDYQGGKGTTLNAGTHVPMIASWPGKISPQSVSQQLVDFSDVLPTLADAGNGTLPTDRNLDGRSFLGHLRGHQETEREWVYCWYERNGKRDGNVRRYARDHQFKLYRAGSFFDLSTDDREEHALAVDVLAPEVSVVRDDLEKVLDRLAKAEADYSPPRKNRVAE
ncbi:MAG: sulfatase-like hydrolase/transferase [Planctomycetales bacterium]|nr:sulfatase-like hydrolase/transferase [Planctomycetales bacterium]